MKPTKRLTPEELAKLANSEDEPAVQVRPGGVANSVADAQGTGPAVTITTTPNSGVTAVGRGPELSPGEIPAAFEGGQKKVAQLNEDMRRQGVEAEAAGVNAIPSPILLTPEQMGRSFQTPEDAERPSNVSPLLQSGRLARFIEKSTGKVINGRLLDDGRLIIAGSELPNRQASHVDPSKFVEVEKREIGGAEALGRSAAQGLSFDLADDAYALIGSAFSDKGRKQLQAEVTEQNDQAFQQHPVIGVGGALASTAVPLMGEAALLKIPRLAKIAQMSKAGSRFAKAAGYGALAGVGSSNALLGTGTDKAMDIGGVLEGAGGGAATGLVADVTLGSGTRAYMNDAERRNVKRIAKSLMKDTDQKARKAVSKADGSGTIELAKYVAQHPVLSKVYQDKEVLAATARELIEDVEEKMLAPIYKNADTTGKKVSGLGLIAEMEKQVVLAEKKNLGKIAMKLRGEIEINRDLLIKKASDVEVSPEEYSRALKIAERRFAANGRPKIMTKAFGFQIEEARRVMNDSLGAGRRITLGELDAINYQVMQEAGKKLKPTDAKEINGAFQDALGIAAHKKGAYGMSFNDAKEWVSGVQATAFEGLDYNSPNIKKAAGDMSMRARDYLNRKVIEATGKRDIIAANKEMSNLIKVRDLTLPAVNRGVGVTQTAPISVSDVKRAGTSVLGFAQAVSGFPIKAAVGANKKLDLALANIVRGAKAGVPRDKMLAETIALGVPHAKAKLVIDSYYRTRNKDEDAQGWDMDAGGNLVRKPPTVKIGK